MAETSNYSNYNSEENSTSTAYIPRWAQTAPMPSGCDGLTSECQQHSACGNESSNLTLTPKGVFGDGASLDPKTGKIVFTDKDGKTRNPRNPDDRKILIDQNRLRKASDIGLPSDGTIAGDSMISKILGKYSDAHSRFSDNMQKQMDSCHTSDDTDSDKGLHTDWSKLSSNIGTESHEKVTSDGCFMASLNNALLLNSVDASLCQLQKKCSCSSTTANMDCTVDMNDVDLGCVNNINIDQHCSQDVTFNVVMDQEFKQTSITSINMANTLSQLAKNAVTNKAKNGALNPDDTTADQFVDNSMMELGMIKTQHNAIQAAIDKAVSEVNSKTTIQLMHDRYSSFPESVLDILAEKGELKCTDININQQSSLQAKIAHTMLAAFESLDNFKSLLDNSGDQTGDNEDDKENDGTPPGSSSGGLIAAIVILGLLFLAATGGFIYYTIRQSKKSRKQSKRLTDLLVEAPKKK